MASITNQPNGRRMLQFYDGDGKRRSIRLGAMPIKMAESLKSRIESLAIASATGLAIDLDTGRWLSSVDDSLAKKLAAAGLIEHRRVPTLDEWLNTYSSECMSELKLGSVKKMSQTMAKLRKHLVPSTKINKLTPSEAATWRKKLRETPLSEGTTKTHAGNAKTIFAAAVARKLLAEDPFAALPSGSTASVVKVYVEPQDFSKFLDALPSNEWRLLFALARYAGLRVPSESHRLTWADVNFETERLHVHSVKTERHEGHAERDVPILADLMPLLRARFNEVAEGDTHLVRIRGQGRIAERYKRACKASGIAAWPRMFQTLRSSCEIQMAGYLPQYAVSRFIGHSIQISGKHYANHVPDEMFKRASAELSQRAAKGAAVCDAVTDRRGSRPLASDSAIASNTNEIATPCDSLRNATTPRKVEAGGIEPPSRDGSCNGLYMLSPSFNLDAPDGDEHSPGESSRQFLTRAPTAECAGQLLSTIHRVGASRQIRAA
jgi:integrase